MGVGTGPSALNIFLAWRWCDDTGARLATKGGGGGVHLLPNVQCPKTTLGYSPGALPSLTDRGGGGQVQA